MLNSAEASVRTSPQDSLIYTRTMQELLPYAGLPAGELMVKTAGMFYGTPYKGGTLETVPEALTVNLHETDCILLVETCTAMTILLKGCTDGGIDIDSFTALLCHIKCSFEHAAWLYRFLNSKDVFHNLVTQF